MDIDLPEVVAEVREAFDRYEKALVANDVDTLDVLFRDDPRTIRYGAAENLYGYDEIKSFRAARSPAGLGAHVVAHGHHQLMGTNFAVASTLYERPSTPGKIGRQMQTWVKFAEGWRVVAAHVSLIDAPQRDSSMSVISSAHRRAERRPGRGLTRAEDLRLQLADEIVRGQLAPGSALDESELARRFSVSRTPVREAIRMLAASGLVEVRAHRAARGGAAERTRRSSACSR